MNLIDSLLKKNKAKHNAPYYLILLSLLKKQVKLFYNYRFTCITFTYFF